jgi:type IV pilus assembly protein PilV
MRNNTIRTEAPVGKAGEAGVVLLEALIAMFVFSIGILGLLGMFTLSIKNTSEAQYRTEAAFLVETLIAQMRVADPLTRATNFASPGGSDYTAWKNRVINAATGLPGASASANLPTVAFSGTGNRVVTIQVRWKSKNDVAVRTFVTETALE